MSERRIPNTSRPEYGIWEGMIRRCENARHRSYPYYGGRGIKVCERWRHDFAAFLADMGPRPSPKHSIDRMDVNGHYAPSNCRWATTKEQASSRRDTRLFTINGVTKPLRDWTTEYGIAYRTAHDRLRRGFGIIAALTLPTASAREAGYATKTTDRILEIGGERMNVAAWCMRVGMSKATVYARLSAGWTPEDALQTSIRRSINGKYV